MPFVALSDSAGRSVPQASSADLDRALNHLRHAEDYYMLVEREPHVFMQVRHPRAYSNVAPCDYIFQLEYKSGPGSELHLAVTYEFDEIAQTFHEYASGDGDWLSRFTWWPFDPNDDSLDDAPPSQVLQRATQAITSAMERHGFRWVKRDRRLRRDRGPWTDLIWIHTTSGNARGRRVGIEVSLSVNHGGYQAWQTARSGSGVGCVDQQQIGYVKPAGPHAPHWNLVGSFELAVADLVYSLSHFALPYFDCFDDELTFPERTAALRKGRLDYIDTLGLFIALDRVDLIGPYLRWLHGEYPLAIQMAATRARRLNDADDAEPGRASGYEALADMLQHTHLLDLLPVV